MAEKRGSKFVETALGTLVAWAAIAAAATADPGGTEGSLRRVAVSAADARATAGRLVAAGFDVLRTRSPQEVELIVNERELAALHARGLAVRVLERGRPMRDIIAERGADGHDGVPLGYPDLDAVHASLAQAQADHPSICRLVDLTARYGTPETFEGRHLFAVRISDNVETDEDEPAALIVAAHHCRELVTPVIALNAITTLIDGYGIDPDITAVIDENEIWIAPVWNPDGYAYVFDVENFWRKNRRVFETAVGVDLNRNYPFGWQSACAGSDDPVSNTYKGPASASEAETQTMIAWTLDRHFARILDYHSAGRETLWGYACLDDHPFGDYLRSEAIAISMASGYGDAQRAPSADGEHYEWQVGARGAYAFLIETENSFQPPYESAQAEAALVFPGILSVLTDEIPLEGRVTDAVTGGAIAADVCVTNATFGNGEANSSGGPFGRYHVFAPPGVYELAYDAEGYLGQSHPVVISAGGTTTRDVRLTPLEFVGDVNRDGRVDFADVLDLLADYGPCPPMPDPCPGDFDGDGMAGYSDVLLILANWD